MPKLHAPLRTPDQEQAGKVSYSTIEAAKLLGTSVQTVQRWMDLGHLRGWRTPGGHRRIDGASVDRLLRLAVLPDVDAGAPAEMRILLVDDSPDDLELLTIVARTVMPGASIASAESGFAALMLIGRALPGLLITDIAMQGFDGLEMIRSLRADPASANLPVIAVSGHPLEEIVRRFGTVPAAVTILRKPVAPSALREAIGRVAPALLAGMALAA